MADSWYYLYTEDFRVEATTAKAVLLVFHAGDKHVWIPRSVLRMDDEEVWEVADWWLEKADLLSLTVEIEPHK